MNARKGWCNSLGGRALTTNKKCVKFLLYLESVDMYILQQKNPTLNHEVSSPQVRLKTANGVLVFKEQC